MPTISFLNESLAKFYGVSGVRGKEFRKVEFDERARGTRRTVGPGNIPHCDLPVDAHFSGETRPLCS